MGALKPLVPNPPHMRPEPPVTYASLLLMAPREGGNSTLVFAIQMVAIFLIFYLLLIRPQKKEQDRHQAMIAALKKGDEVVTSGGIIGTVVHADEGRITIKTAETTRIVVERARIARVTSAKADAKPDAKSEG
jgi:preprotein translocase subunit YajC